MTTWAQASTWSVACMLAGGKVASYGNKGKIMAKMNWDKARRDSIGYQQDSYLVKKDKSDAEFFKKAAALKAKRETLTNIIFIWSRKGSKKVHIATFHGTLCRLENQGRLVIKRLKARGKAVPEGRELCQLCATKADINPCRAGPALP